MAVSSVQVLSGRGQRTARVPLSLALTFFLVLREDGGSEFLGVRSGRLLVAAENL